MQASIMRVPRILTAVNRPSSSHEVHDGPCLLGENRGMLGGGGKRRNGYTDAVDAWWKRNKRQKDVKVRSNNYMKLLGHDFCFHYSSINTYFYLLTSTYGRLSCFCVYQLHLHIDGHGLTAVTSL